MDSPTEMELLGDFDVDTCGFRVLDKINDGKPQEAVAWYFRTMLRALQDAHCVQHKYASLSGGLGGVQFALQQRLQPVVSQFTEEQLQAMQLDAAKWLLEVTKQKKLPSPDLLRRYTMEPFMDALNGQPAPEDTTDYSQQQLKWIENKLQELLNK